MAIIILILGAGFLLAMNATAGESDTKVTTPVTGSGGPLSTFANAIGLAEGFFVSGSRPQRNNNPGDLISGVPPASNYTTNSDGTYAIFDNVSDGWQALEDQLDAIRRGSSNYYSTTMTFNQMAQSYSPSGWQAWAKNVSSALGAAPTEQIGAYL